MAHTAASGSRLLTRWLTILLFTSALGAGQRSAAQVPTRDQASGQPGAADALMAHLDASLAQVPDGRAGVFEGACAFPVGAARAGGPVVLSLSDTDGRLAARLKDDPACSVWVAALRDGAVLSASESGALAAGSLVPRRPTDEGALPSAYYLGLNRYVALGGPGVYEIRIYIVTRGEGGSLIALGRCAVQLTLAQADPAVLLTQADALYEACWSVTRLPPAPEVEGIPRNAGLDAICAIADEVLLPHLDHAARLFMRRDALESIARIGSERSRRLLEAIAVCDDGGGEAARAVLAAQEEPRQE